MNKRDFYRTDISGLEKSIGGLILLLLLGIGLGLVYKGRSYEATLYTGDPEALESTRTAVEGKAATVRGAGDLRGYELAGAGRIPAGASGTDLATGIADLSPLGPTELYSVETLYEKINGRAPAYFQFNFQELTSRSFLVDGTAGDFIDAYLFRMDSPINAFGIFSIERSEAGAPLDFVADGYRSGMGYFLRQGTTYVQVITSSSDPRVMALAEDFSRELVAAIPADNAGLEGRFLLPAEGQVPGSLTYISEDAYGQSVLSRIFEARYATGGGELTLFGMSCATEEEARGKWEAVRGFYGKFGSLEEAPPVGNAEVFIAESFGQWNIILTSGQTVAGVINANDRERALEFLQAHFGSRTEESESGEEYIY